MKRHWWGISCSRRNQPASHRTAAESASQPPHCWKKGAIRKTDVHFNRRAESNSQQQHSRRLAESRVPGGRRNQPQIRGGWRKSFLRPRCPTCMKRAPFPGENKMVEKKFACACTKNSPVKTGLSERGHALGIWLRYNKQKTWDLKKEDAYQNNLDPLWIAWSDWFAASLMLSQKQGRASFAGLQFVDLLCGTQ